MSSKAVSANAIMHKMVFGLRAAAASLVLVTATVVMLVVGAITFFQFRRFYAEQVLAPFAKLMLLIFGIRLRVHGNFKANHGQVIYISNHSSTIDIFALVALGLPNTRFFLSSYLKKLIPLGIIGTIVGNFWIVTQKLPEQRVAIFKAAEQTLRKTGESVYLSPEGKRVTTGEIGAFNKGSFHLATVLQAPMIPLFIYIPKSIDPGKGLAAHAGYVDVYLGEAIPTDHWQVSDLLENKEHVRSIFVNWHRQLHHG